MNRFLLPASLLLGTALCQHRALAQPAAPDSKTKTPTFSVAELEQFLGGRTLLSLDLKDATLEQVAAALSAASGRKIEPRASIPAMLYQSGGKPPIALPAQLYGFSASKTAFWPALRASQLAARRASLIAPAPTAPAAGTFVMGGSLAPDAVPNSLGLSKSASGWWLHPDNGLADGRAVQAWPFLVIANDLKRNQDGSLSEDGLDESANPAPPGLTVPAKGAKGAPGAKATATAATATDPKATDAEQWSDRLTLGGQVLIDPKLNPLGLRCEIQEATDDKGNDLHFSGETMLRVRSTPPTRIVTPPNLKMPKIGGTAIKMPDLQARFDSQAPATDFSQSLQISLRSKPGMGKKLVRLRGVLRFSVVSRSQHWETTQLDRPIDGTVFQNGAEFKVQFKGLEKTENGWSAGFAAQSRGAQLEEMWKKREAIFSSMKIIGGGPRRDFSGSLGSTVISVAGASKSSFGDNIDSLGALNFAGVPQMSLVDENGRVFEMSEGQSSSSLMRQVPGEAPTPVSPGLSPLPPDLAQNYSFDESRAFDFNSPSGASGAGAAMGKPVKLILDLPLERREISVPFEFTNLPLPPS